MKILIRKASVYDAEEINKCLKLAFKEYEKEACESAAKGALSESVETTAEDISAKLFLVAELGGKIIGSVRVLVEDNCGYLSRFSVLPEYHKYGTGKLLLDKVDEYMLKMSASSIYLHTCLDVEHLVSFYRKNGFEVESVSTERGYNRAKLVKKYGE